MSNQAQYATAAVATVGVVGGAYCLFRAYQASAKKRLPDRWTHAGTLKAMTAYPIKSCRAVPLEKAECSFMGLKSGWLRDRSLMIVDETNSFVTARVYQEMYSVQPAVSGAMLTLTAPGLGAVHVNLAEVIVTQTKKKSSVWGTEVPLYDCGDEVSEWLTKVVNHPPKSFRLMYYASQKSRDSPTHPTGIGALSDDTSFNMINEASVQDLNTRLREDKVTTNHFRSNFVLSGAKAYEEDNWKFVKIGDNIFEIIMPCTRCVMTTIDPETGVRNANNEPLKTLRSYRLVEGEKYRKAVGTSPRMGVQMALRSSTSGLVSLNDDIYVA